MDLSIVARRPKPHGQLEICGKHVSSATRKPGEEHVPYIPAEGNKAHSWDVPTRRGLMRRIVEFVPLSNQNEKQRKTYIELLKKHYPADFPG